MEWRSQSYIVKILQYEAQMRNQYFSTGGNSGVRALRLLERVSEGEAHRTFENFSKLNLKITENQNLFENFTYINLKSLDILL